MPQEKHLLTHYSIIQDCEDALTNWVSQNASVSSKLSQRSRTLSQRRRNQNRNMGEGVDLSGQDQALDRESGLWIPAEQHQGKGYDDREDLDDDVNSTIASEHQRGREDERIVAA